VKVLALNEERPGCAVVLVVTPEAALAELLGGRPAAPGSELRPSACATERGERDQVAVTSTPTRRML
jgi:hypothetical protein